MATKNIHKKQNAEIYVENEKKNNKEGVKQVCLLSSLLFKINFDKTMKPFKIKLSRLQVGRKLITTYFYFSDDIAKVRNNQKTLKNIIA